jgi:small multidrug resistance pump
MSAWVWLLMAILFEVVGTICLKLSDGLTKLTPTFVTFIFYLACFSSLAIALKKWEVGIAYAIWSGLGTVIISAIGISYFGESLTLLKIVYIALIVLGVVGLNFVETH